MGAQRLLIVDPDLNFRTQVYNFLLSAGYDEVDTAESCDQALVKICQSASDVILIGTEPTLRQSIECAKRITALQQDGKVVLMVPDEYLQSYSPVEEGLTEFPVIIKTTFKQNLLFILENEEIS